MASCALASWKNEPPKQRHAPALASRKDFLATDSTLSLLEPQGAQCMWTKLDAVSRKRLTISTFDGDCRGGKIALSADRGRGAVWFDPSAAALEEHAPPGARPRLFEVDLANGTATPVPLPSGTRDLGFDAKGRMIALTLQELTEAETDRGEVLVDGTPVKLEPASAGNRVLVHAFAFEDASWKRIETASSTVSSDDAPGVGELTAARDLAFRSTEVLAPFVQGDIELDEALLGSLARFAPWAHPVEGRDSWIRFGSGDTRFVLWEVSTEVAYSTGLAAFVDEAGNPVRPPGWPYTEKDLVSYAWNGAYLLAARQYCGSRARLYRGRELVWSSDTAQAVTFWPPRRRRPRRQRR